MTIRDISSVRRCTLPVSKLLDGGIGSFYSFAQSAYGETWQAAC